MHIVFYAEESFSKRQYIKIFRDEEGVDCADAPDPDTLIDYVFNQKTDAVFLDKRLFTLSAFENCCQALGIALTVPVFLFDSSMSPAENQAALAEHCNGLALYEDSPAMQTVLRGITSPTILEREQLAREYRDSPPLPPVQMRPSLRDLYSYLFSFRNQDVSLDMMAMYLWRAEAAAHTKTLYSYIHQIRKFLGDSTRAPMRLIRMKTGVYRLIITPAEESFYRVF